jgi:hypothetical protein
VNNQEEKDHDLIEGLHKVIFDYIRPLDVSVSNVQAALGTIFVTGSVAANLNPEQFETILRIMYKHFLGFLEDKD